MLISELAERTGLSTRALRHYEDRGLLIPARDTNGYRIFDDADLTRVSQIKTMIAAGLGTKAIREYLDCVRSDADTHSLVMCPKLRAELDSLAAWLATQQAALRQTQQRLCELSAAC